MAENSVGKLARRLFLDEGYNCAEAAYLAIAKDHSEAEKALGCRLVGGFGGGAGSGHICGALAGAVAGLGLFFGRQPGEPRADQLRALAKALSEGFEAEFGSVNCRDIKPEGEGFRQRCADFVEWSAQEAVRLIDEALVEDDDCG